MPFSLGSRAIRCAVAREDHELMARFHAAGSGNPAVSLPVGQSREGLPIGVQLVAAHGREDLLLAVAAQLEQAVPWKDRRPSVFVG